MLCHYKRERLISACDGVCNMLRPLVRVDVPVPNLRALRHSRRHCLCIDALRSLRHCFPIRSIIYDSSYP